MRKFTACVRWMANWFTHHKAATALAIAVLLLAVPFHYSFAVSELFTKFATNPIDTTMITLAGIVQVITGAIGQATLALIQMVVIPVLGYNGFYNSHITNLGWSLVRDVVNMFVVAVLMVIAIMTIIGYSAANWTQQLPKLFIAIVLVNFSKLICGFLIDVSQVIMFTFVNAIVSIAAGNFASMLSLNTFGQFGADFIEKINAKGTGLEAFEFLMAAYLQFVVLLGILGVIFLLAAAFVWRIVILWVLIIMSPLAFFMVGVKDVFHAAESSYKTWWSKFTSALIFGPTMVFFLWLALAASSGSNLAQTEDFPMPETQGDAGIPLKMFDLNNFLGMFLALAILLAGMQQASASAGALGGWAASALSEGMGKGLLKGLARPVNSAKRLGQFGVKGGKVGGVEVPGLAKVAPGLTQQFGKGLANAGTGLSKKLGGGVVASAIGGTFASAGAFVANEGKEERKKLNKAGAEVAEHMTDDQKTAYNLAKADIAAGDADVAAGNASILKAQEVLKNEKSSDDQKRLAEADIVEANARIKEAKNRVSAGNGVLAQFGGEVHGARTKELVTKEKAQKKLREEYEKKYKDAGAKNYKELAAKDYNAVMAQELAFASTDEGKAFLQLSGEEKDSIEDTYTANPHLIKAKGDKSKVDMIMEHFQKMEDKKRLNVGAISTNAFADPDARKAMESFTRKDRDGVESSVWADLESGKGTIAQRDALVAMISVEDVRSAEKGVQSVASLVRAHAVADGDDSRRAAIIERLNQPNAGGLPGSVHGAASAALLNYKKDGKAVYSTGDVLGAEFAAMSTTFGADADTKNPPSIVTRANAMVTADSKTARFFDSQVTDAPNAASFAVAGATKKDDIRRLQRVIAEKAGTSEAVDAEKALEVMGKSVTAESKRANISKARGDQLKNLAQELGVESHYRNRRNDDDDNNGGGTPPPIVGGPSGGGNGGGGSSGGSSGGAAPAQSSGSTPSSGGSTTASSSSASNTDTVGPAIYTEEASRSSKPLGKIYENPYSDPDIGGSSFDDVGYDAKEGIEDRARREAVSAVKAHYPKLKVGGIEWMNEVQKIQADRSRGYYNDFVRNNPEKAAAYASRHAEVGQAFERYQREQKSS